MQEMLNKDHIKGESSMKRTLIVVALAAALVLALGATPAFAKYAGFSSTTQYVAWEGSTNSATSLASLNPDAALMAAGPHAGYATTTIKCAVCHSVHRGGSQLLNEGAVCAYCHTEAAWGGGAVAANLISWDANDPAAAGAGPHQSCASSYCHGGPHGVGASTYDGPASKLFVAVADTELDEYVTANDLADNAAVDGSFNPDLDDYTVPATRALATAAVCGRSGCHDDSMFGVVASGAATAVDTGGAITGTVTGHRVIATNTATWNADGSFPTTKTNLTIAYAPVAYCSSCHDLVDDNNSGLAAFPHALSGVVDAAAGATGTWRPAVWLTAGAYAGATRYAVGPYNAYTVTDINGDADTTDVSDAAGSSILDGICLKCHRGSAVTGVGLTY